MKGNKISILEGMCSSGEFSQRREKADQSAQSSEKPPACDIQVSCRTKRGTRKIFVLVE